MGGKVKSTMGKKLKNIASTQQYLPILDVQDDIIVTKDERYIKLMEFSPINFELRSPAEQDQIISVFGTFQKIFHNGPQLISTDEQTYHFC